MAVASNLWTMVPGCHWIRKWNWKGERNHKNFQEHPKHKSRKLKNSKVRWPSNDYNLAFKPKKVNRRQVLKRHEISVLHLSPSSGDDLMVELRKWSAVEVKPWSTVCATRVLSTQRPEKPAVNYMAYNVEYRTIPQLHLWGGPLCKYPSEPIIAMQAWRL